MRTLLICILQLSFFFSRSQTNRIFGIVEDAKTAEPLAGASIMLFQSSGRFGGITNGEGKFSFSQIENLDSIRISMIGYQSRVWKKNDLNPSLQTYALDPVASALQEVVVIPMDPAEIVLKAIQKIPEQTPQADFESRAFYREIISDSSSFFSVAEAIFKIQMQVRKKSVKLSLEKGRSKEDVSLTRLFEDYHPGGGPEDAIGQSIFLHRPPFLDAYGMKKFIYKKDATIQQDRHTIYKISFDQKPGIHEALEKGIMYINAEDYSLVKFEAENSPLGNPYIKNLTGSDKLFAELLHIDLRVKGWTRSVSFEEISGKIYLAHAKIGYKIDYKQPKKDLDLHLTIQTEWVTTDFLRPVTKGITGAEEWKRKNLMANLPADFDHDFWGSSDILDPTAEISQIIASISRKNNDAAGGSTPGDWLLLNKGLFVVYGKQDSIVLVPIAKCFWDENITGPLMYKNIKGDFSLEIKLSVFSRTYAGKEPDNGFQQGGIMIRGDSAHGENYLMLSLGTGGNSIPKFFLKKTENGKTKTSADKTGNMTGCFRVEKQKGKIIVYKRPDEQAPWEKWGDFTAGWINGDLQVGLTVTARFAGDGPKQRPDLKAIFSKIKMESP